MQASQRGNWADVEAERFVPVALKGQRQAQVPASYPVWCKGTATTAVIKGSIDSIADGSRDGRD